MSKSDTPKIVFSEYGTTIVRLSESYGGKQDSFRGKQEICNASINLQSGGGAILIRMKSNGKLKKFTLNIDEMNALCTAWSNLQAEQEAKDKQAFEEVREFLDAHPEVEIIVVGSDSP